MNVGRPGGRAPIRRVFTVGAALAASFASAGPVLISATNAVVRDATAAGGDGRSSSATNALDTVLGEEVSSSTGTSSATNRMGGGYMQIYAFPGPAVGLGARSDITVSSATLVWNAPGYDGLQGHLVTGTTYFIRIASYTVPDTFSFINYANMAISTDSVTPSQSVGAPATGLLTNTSYYVQLWTLDAAGNISFPTRSTITSLANPPPLGLLEFLSIQSSSVTVAWAALPPSPPDASSKTCEGYTLLASSDDFGALAPYGAPQFSSTTYSVLASTLTLGSSGAPLDLSSTYYFKVGSLNWAGAPNYTQLQRLNFQITQSTNYLSFGLIDPNIARSTIATSSMVVTNVGNWPVTIELTASTVTLPSSPWALSTSSGVDTAVLLGVWFAGAIGPPAIAFNTSLTTTTTISQTSGNYSSAAQNGYQLAPGANISLWVRFFLPTSSSTVGPERLQVAAVPVYP